MNSRTRKRVVTVVGGTSAWRRSSSVIVGESKRVASSDDPLVEESVVDDGQGRLHQGNCIMGNNVVDENGTTTTTTTTTTHSAGLRCELCERLGSNETTERTESTEKRTEDGDSKSKGNSRDGRSRRENFRGERTKPPEIITSTGSGLGDNRSLKCASSVVRWNPSGVGRTFHTNSSAALLWIAVAIIATIATAASAEPSRYQFRSPGNSSHNTKREVCQSIDIRNNATQLNEMLDGCRIVEGFVQILLIDYADDSDFANLTFPKLIEITGYLVLYRVNGLKSVGHLFPNLTVIRGHSLFINYALVAFEMMHLQEIGLHSLTDILRGSVRFEKNPALCYVDTIDWDVIAKAGKGEHVISRNKPKNGCPVCKKDCPSRLTKPDETLCWNRQYCQKICDRQCGERACSANGTMCCHPSCLGSCSGPSEENCTVCREVAVKGNRCEKQCRAGMYEFMNHRCVTKSECRKMKRPREAFGTMKEYPYKPFNGSCILECPAGYMDEEKNGEATCEKCDGLCQKECTGALVDSIASAQKIRGCTHISGSLEIQIRGGKNIVKELEDSLKTIEEIDGYLKIVRSFPLISLNFLKSLRIIRGNSLDNGKYTLAVLDNQNLQELWDWGIHPAIQILSKDGPAKVFFHFNPKLCLQKIEALREVAGLNEFSELEVARNSNGDKVACNVTDLSTDVSVITSEAALIQWEAFDHHDPRSLLGYVVYFIEAPSENVTMYDGRDACGGDGWRVDDVSAPEPPSTVLLNETQSREPHYLTHILTQLKPYTQYAFYVKTYTIATERSGAQSRVRYFTTLPDAPSQPRALSIWSNASSELVISWSPPVRKNGNLTHYKIIGRWDRDDPAFVAQRNYCDKPMLLPEKKPISVMAEEERKRAEAEKEMDKLPDAASCSCADREPDQANEREKEVSSSIAFEDALHNQVYVKRHNQRRRRDVGGILSAIPWKRDTSYAQDKEPSTDIIENGTYIRFEKLVPSSNHTFVMRNLRHFAEYYIEIVACREKVVNDTLNNCSTKAVKAYRTLPIESADNIPPNTFKLSMNGGNNSNTLVKLRWDEPPQPNGLIVTYQIEYKRVDIQNIQATLVCIPRRDFVNEGYSYTLKDLPAGNYSVKVRATSLAGTGADSEVIYFSIKEYNTSGRFWVLFWSISSIIIVVLCPVTFYVCKRKFMRNVPSMRLIATVNPEYVSTVYIPDEWEVPRKKIQLLRELGNGSFGMVYEGLAKDVVKSKPEVRCAVKTVNENATDRERIEFLNEASVMKAFNTHHVVRLLGVVSQGQPTLVVMELMVNGDLKTYLRSHRPDQCENFMRQPPTLKRILRMATEIADGMAYLSAKKFVHRDLAARNCMVAEDLTVKIGDFGMTRDIYETDYYRKGTKGLLPVRWMAPESLKDGVFTSFSDVWSYGVVLWEMVTLASQPYQGLSNDQVLRYVIDGGVMERPENCPDSMYTLMRRTWNHKANRRPTFIDIATMLLHEVDVEGFDRVSFYHSSEGIEARNQNSSHSPHNDKDLELTALHDLREDEAEGDEDSPLRQDFGDFASIEPACTKNNSHSRYGPGGSYGENSKVVTNFHDLNSSKIPLKAGFDDFDGVSAGSLNSSKDTLDFPFVEDSLKSVKNSPSIKKTSSSRGSLSLKSIVQPRSPPNNIEAAVSLQTSPQRKTKSQKNSPDYENRTPEVMSMIDGKEAISMHINFPSIDAIDGDAVVVVDDNGKEKKLQSEYTDKPETLNNGFISGTTT